MAQKILLDTDLGTFIDDSLALLYALKSPRLDLRAVTTVYWDSVLRKKLVDKILSPNTRDIEVHAGESMPIRSFYPITWFTGIEGKGILDEEDLNRTPEGLSGDAVDFLIEEINSHPGEYALVTIGPLTNLARALQKQPSIEDKIKHHYATAGLLYHKGDDAQMFCFPEHNVACDVDAAKIVFNSRTSKTIIPANIGHKALISKEDLEKLKENDSLNKSVRKLINARLDINYKTAKQVNYLEAHDPLTLIALTNPEIIKTEELPISIDNDGITTIDERGAKVNVATEADYPRFKSVFLDTILK